MKKMSMIALLCSGALLAACSGKDSPSAVAAPSFSEATPEPTAVSEPATRENTASVSASQNRLYTLEGINDEVIIEADGSGDYVLAFAGEIARTYFFDIQLTDAAMYETYADAIAANDDYLLLAATVKITNTGSEEIEMYDEDFQIEWYDEEGKKIEDGYDEVLTYYDLDAVGDMLQPVYKIGAGETVTGDLLFEVPNDVRKFSLVYLEEFDNDTTGDLFYIDFELK